MAQALHCRLLTPHSICFEGEVVRVMMPGRDGRFGVLPRHMWLLSELKMGLVVLKNAKQHHCFFIDGGCTEVTANSCVILADDAQDMAQFDHKACQKDHDAAVQKGDTIKASRLHAMMQAHDANKRLT